MLADIEGQHWSNIGLSGKPASRFGGLDTVALSTTAFVIHAAIKHDSVYVVNNTFFEHLAIFNLGYIKPCGFGFVIF